MLCREGEGLDGGGGLWNGGVRLENGPGLVLWAGGSGEEGWYGVAGSTGDWRERGRGLVRRSLEYRGLEGAGKRDGTV